MTTRDPALAKLQELEELAQRVRVQAQRLGADHPEVNALAAEIQQRQVLVLARLSSIAELAERFVTLIEAHGGTFAFRPGSTDWRLDLNGVPDLTKAEAHELATAALEIRDEIRRVLLLRRGDDQTIH